MTEITNGELMSVLLNIEGKVSHNEGKLDSFTAEVRSAFARAQTDGRAQDDRINALERTGGRAEGRIEHRNLVGHIATGVLAAGAAIIAMWTGVFGHPH